MKEILGRSPCMSPKVKLYVIEWRIDGELVDTFNFFNPRPISVTNGWIEYLESEVCKTGVLTPKIANKPNFKHKQK